MDERTLNALKMSITRWENNVFRAKNNLLVVLGPHACPLCHLFRPEDGRGYYEDTPDDCIGCPVYAKTGQQYCVETPYIRVCRLHPGDVSPREFIQACQDELDFLRSLLPEE